jgi:hypothetical protein
MAAGDKTLMFSGRAGKLLFDIWAITTNGTTAVNLKGSVTQPQHVEGGWSEKITTADSMEFVVTANQVAVTCVGATAKTATIMVWGF